MNKYTSLETSKLIASKVHEGETDAWHVSYLNLGEVEYNIYSEFQAQRAVESGWVFEKLSRAYRFDDVLRAIQVWGENEGWNDAWSCVCSVTGKKAKRNPVFLADCLCHREVAVTQHSACHELLTAYIDDGLQFGERSEGVIRSIFEEPFTVNHKVLYGVKCLDKKDVIISDPGLA